MDIERPVAIVRAAFLDVDLVVRDKIHRGMRFEWIPRDASGERRLRQKVFVMGRVVTEDVVIEPGPGDTWVKRFVEGPNAGTRFVAGFEALAPALTRVRMEAYVGPRGFALGLGKLSPLGLEKAMQRVMGEYKAALQAYEPGRARGTVLAALAVAQHHSLAMSAMDEARRKALTATLLEAAWAIACVDEGPNEAERDAMRAIVAGIWHATLGADLEERMVKAAVDAMDRQGVEARCDALGARLKALGFGALGVSLAVLVAEVSHGLDAVELAALHRLAAAAGLDELDLEGIVRDTEAALSGGERLSQVSQFV
jgi:glycosyltransferase A (GT-A) superfamily protein (DUF2064 family)